MNCAGRSRQQSLRPSLHADFSRVFNERRAIVFAKRAIDFNESLISAAKTYG